MRAGRTEGEDVLARVFVDTNVLFPFSVMDLMLGLTEDSVHEIVWSQRLLAEWERVIVREHRRTAASAAAVTRAIREFFGDCEVAESSYRHLVDLMPGDDPDDRHHSAAAVAAGAGVLLTWNAADFPRERLAVHGLRVVDPDRYMCGLFSEVPDEVAGTVLRMSAQKRNPPMTAHDVADRLSKAGLSRFAELVRPLLGPDGGQR